MGLGRATAHVPQDPKPAASSQDRPLHDGGGLYLRKRDAAAWWDLRSTGVDPRQARQRQIEEVSAKAEAERIEEERKVTVLSLFDRWAQTDLQPRLRTDGKREGRKDGGQYTREQFNRRIFPKLGHRPAAEVTRGEDCGLNARSTEAIWLTLATGVRVGELMGAVWKSSAQNLEQLRSLADADGVKLGMIDREARTWHLLETKNQRDHTIHLSDFALSRIATLWDLRTLDLQAQVYPWVFPSMAATGPVCVKSFGKQLADRQRPPEKRMSDRARNTKALLLPGGRWTAHDLRRTAATLMAEIGVSGDVIDECLNHIIESKVHRVYIRNRREEAQAVAFDALGAVLAEIVDKAAAT